MTNDTTYDGIDPSASRSVPADLAAILVYTSATVAAIAVPVMNTTPLRAVLAVPFVLFIPGYAIVAALYPERHSLSAVDGNSVSAVEANSATTVHRSAETNHRRDQVGIAGIERVALSFGVSVAVVPLIGLALDVTPFGLRLTPVLVSVSGLTVAVTGIAIYRRLQLPKAEQLIVPYRSWIRSAMGVFSGHDSRRDAALSLLVVVSVLVAVSSAGYAFAVPNKQIRSPNSILSQNRRTVNSSLIRIRRISRLESPNRSLSGSGTTNIVVWSTR